MRISRSYVYIYMRAILVVKLMYYPAAMSNYAEYGGLLSSHQAHDDEYNKPRGIHESSRSSGCWSVIHDIEKLNEILSDKNGISPGYSFKGQMLGLLLQGITL